MYNYSIQNTVWCFTLVKWTLFSFGEISTITDSYNITDSILRLIFHTKKDIWMNKMLYLLKLWGGGGGSWGYKTFHSPLPNFHIQCCIMFPQFFHLPLPWETRFPPPLFLLPVHIPPPFSCVPASHPPHHFTGHKLPEFEGLWGHNTVHEPTLSTRPACRSLVHVLSPCFNFEGNTTVRISYILNARLFRIY